MLWRQSLGGHRRASLRVQAQSQSTISVCRRGQQVPCRWPKELDDRVLLSYFACWLCTVHLLIAVVLPHSFLLCVFPDQLIPGVIGLPQHPCSVTNFLSRIRVMRERKRHFTSMPRLSVWETFWMSVFRDVDLDVSHASSETGELAW